MSHVAVAGSSGIIGAALVAALRERGVEVRRLVRRAPRSTGEVTWDPSSGVLDPAALDGAAAVVNLAGRSISGSRWTERVRREILDSRVLSTRLIVEAIARAPRPPVLLVSASAVGYYGDRGGELLDESSSPGDGFLAGVARAWEEEAGRAGQFGTRVVTTRFGLVLSPTGGVLGRLLPLFRLGLGGTMGGGHQWWSWVHIDDVVGALLAAIGSGAAPPTATALDGSVNVATPEPATNRDFVRALAGALRRPALVPVPALALRLALGAMADEMILASQRVRPAKLLAAGFGFRWPELGPALRDLISGRR